MGNALVFARESASNRAASEDRAEVHLRGDALIVVVADGAGGMAGGGFASDALVNAVRISVDNVPRDPYDLRAWSEVFSSIDATLARGLVGETTAIVAVVGPDAVLGISVGDSEAWVVAPARTDRLTDRQDRKRLGSGRARPVAFHRRGALDGLLVIGTDGLFKHTSPERIAMSCRESDAAGVARRLVVLPRSASGGYADDVAVVVVTRPSGATR